MKLSSLTAALTLAGLAAAGAQAASQEDGPPVETMGGLVSGHREGAVTAYRGIPYAKPPVGDLRWRAPRPISWHGVLAADDYGPDCMQEPFAEDEAPLRTTPSEDCLYLNLWAPADAEKGGDLPVIVWIHGGGWVNGGTSPAVYSGAPTAREGAVFVSFNYRLGRFGFFAHPALTAADEDGGQLGNYGYMDQLAALEWVSENVTAFGGDPENVTLIGESAGGGSVVNLLTNHRADSLFHKAVAMSAPARLDSSLKPLHAEDRPDAEDDGEAFAEWAGISGQGPDALAALRKLPAETVVAGTGMMTEPVAPASGPMLDGRLLVGADDVLMDGGQVEVPTMAGAVSEDIGFGPPLPPDAFFAQFPDPEAARDAYAEFAEQPEALLRFAYADMFMQEPARLIVEAQAQAGAPAYYYRYGYVAETMRDQWSGTRHATEIPFFLNTLDARYPGAVTQGDRDAANLIHGYLVDFARSGDPNGPGRPVWPAYAADDPKLMQITLEGAAAGPDPWQARLDAAEARAAAATASK